MIGHWNKVLPSMQCFVFFSRMSTVDLVNFVIFWVEDHIPLSSPNLSKLLKIKLKQFLIFWLIIIDSSSRQAGTHNGHGKGLLQHLQYNVFTSSVWIELFGIAVLLKMWIAYVISERCTHTISMHHLQMQHLQTSAASTTWHTK